MSWLQKLYETYELCATNPEFTQGENPLLPICHTSQKAHIEIVIDDQGNFKRATVLSGTITAFPATEKSITGRTSGCAPYPLCEKIQYCAADYSKYGGTKKSYFTAYSNLLSKWCSSNFTHPKAEAVLTYVRKENIIQDLVNAAILHTENDQLIFLWQANSNLPDIIKSITGKKSTKKDLECDQGDALIRWRVEKPENPLSATWDDRSLMDKWIKFDTNQEAEKGICMVTGKEMILAKLHPAKLRHGGDKAKLISSNDKEGFTFLGRFTDKDAKQACGVGLEVSQKAHNVLRWLITRQAYKKNGQTFISWAVAGTPLPDPFENTLEILGIESDEQEPIIQEYQGDAGQAFGKRLSKKISGYQAKLGATDDVVVMGMDSATDGRMAITFYRELKGSEFLARIKIWHSDFAWQQNYGWDSKVGKRIQFGGAPSPKDISEVAYGHRDDKGTLQLDDKLQKATIERLLPCIIDGLQMPRDLVESTVRRACNRIGMKKNRHNGRSFEDDWEKTLGIACALFKGYYFRHPIEPRNYQMALENRTSRDYLYGRLLAIADYLEYQALHIADENRDTNAAKLMQRFADHPYSTWRNIELSINPSKTRLRSKMPGLLVRLEKSLDEVYCLFNQEEFIEDRKLSGEFLLGFHCQRQALWNKPEKPEQDDQAIVDDEI